MKATNLVLLVAALIPEAAMAQSAAWDDYLFTYTPGAGWSSEWVGGNEDWFWEGPGITLLGDVHLTFKGSSSARINELWAEWPLTEMSIDHPDWLANFSGIDAYTLTTSFEFDIEGRRYFKTWKGIGPEFSTEFGFDVQVTEDDPAWSGAIGRTDFRPVGEPGVVDPGKPAAFFASTLGQVELVRVERAPDAGRTLTMMAMAILSLAAIRTWWQTVLH